MSADLDETPLMVAPLNVMLLETARTSEANLIWNTRQDEKTILTNREGLDKAPGRCSRYVLMLMLNCNRVGFVMAFGLGAICASFYKMAVHASPVMVEWWAAFARSDPEGGPVFAFAVGFVARVAVFGIGQSVCNSC